MSPRRGRREIAVWWTKGSCICLGLFWKPCFRTNASKLEGLQEEATKMMNGCRVLPYKIKGQTYCIWKGGLKGCEDCWAAFMRFPGSGNRLDTAGQRNGRRASQGDLDLSRVGRGCRLVAGLRLFCRERRPGDVQGWRVAGWFPRAWFSRCALPWFEAREKKD